MREHTQTGEWLAFLNDATSQIGAALDLDRTALGFCEATVPFFADSAVVCLLDALFTDRVIPSVPSAVTAVRRMVTIPAPVDWAAPSPVEPDSPFAQAMATGHPELIPAAAAGGLPAARLDQQCETLLRELDIAKREDDVALLMARLCGIPADQVANWILEPHPRTPGQVRRLVRATLAGWGLADHSELAELLACEVVTNAVGYATRPIAVRLLRTDVLLCEVSDDDHRLPVLQDPSSTDESGRGLHLVAQLATRWGASRLPAGKVVWFEQSIEGSG